jgi:hypothetical protein
MKKTTAILLTAGLIMGGAIAFLAINGPSVPARYTNTNVKFGSVSIAQAKELCPMEGHPRLVCLANALKKTATPKLLAELQRPYSAEDARKWSNFPPAIYDERVGPTLGEFTPEQLGLVKAMLIEASGIAANEGYDELEQLLNAEDFLSKSGGDGLGFSSGNFHFALLGEPAAKGHWQLYFGGHHTAVSNSYTDGKLTGATPSFRGVEPFAPFTMNGRSNQPMVQERHAFGAMLKSLNSAQAKAAKLDQEFTDLLAGPQNDRVFPAQRVGQRVGALSAAQQDLVMAAIATYVQDIDSRNGDAIMARYRSQLADTYIAYSGTAAMNSEYDYVRIDGPTVWIEMSMQPGIETEGIHPHSVWRDRAGDYGGR